MLIFQFENSTLAYRGDIFQVTKRTFKYCARFDKPRGYFISRRNGIVRVIVALNGGGGGGGVNFRVRVSRAVSRLAQLMVLTSVRGSQRRFPSKYIENTFKAIQSTFKTQEMHSTCGAIKFVSVRSS